MLEVDQGRPFHSPGNVGGVLLWLQWRKVAFAIMLPAEALLKPYMSQKHVQHAAHQEAQGESTL